MRILRKTTTLLLTIILFVLVAVMMFILSAKTLITKENLSQFSKSVDVLNVDLGVIFNLEEKGITLEEEIYKLAIDSKIPEPIIKDILRSEEINILLGDFFKNTIDYILKDNIKPSISNDTVDKMIIVANTSLEDHMNIMMSEQELEIHIREYCKKITDIVPDRNLILKDYAVDNINKIVYFDMTNIYILILVVCILIIIVNKSIYKLFRYLGSVMILDGVIFVVLGCLNDFFSAILITRYNNLGNFLEPLTTNILTIIFKNGVLVSFSGVFIYLIYIIANRIKLNSKINELLSKR